ncbi:helix-turn-helix domain-containing protein [Dyella lutea]|uniref:CRP-like protein Clp n=1 Tax=Dyella lutea TaxID=2950441 RepID=A0ABT1FD07_9GAMM|nr:helix-turn-helix domain-containing protein [Dyella lutea]MCP1375267.1 helix-turn-helix domain-containing protein [Dyella lutea]
MSATIASLSDARKLADDTLHRSAFGRALINVASRFALHVHRLQKGAHLTYAGAPFRSLFLLTSGSAKATRPGADGREQVTRFYMAEDLLGLDALDAGVHPTSIRMLEYSVALEIPLPHLEQVGIDIHGLYVALIRKLSHEVEYEQQTLLLLGSARAEERLATFLLELGRRYAERGCSSSEYVLRMTREDIASYLGLKLETVSRGLSRLNRIGAVDVQGRSIHIRDPAQLERSAVWGREAVRSDRNDLPLAAA